MKLKLQFSHLDEPIVCTGNIEIIHTFILNTCYMCLTEDLRMIHKKLSYEIPHADRLLVLCEEHHSELFGLINSDT